MDIRRLTIFIVLALLLLLLWDKYIMPKQANIASNSTQSASQNNTALPADGFNNSNHSNQSIANNALTNDVTVSNNSYALAKPILVTTDLLQVEINSLGGNITSVALLAHGSDNKDKQPYQMLETTEQHQFIEQSGLMLAGVTQPIIGNLTVFSSDKINYVLKPNQDQLIVKLSTNINNINGNAWPIVVNKVYTFKRNSYVIDVGYQIANASNQALSSLAAYFQLLRDDAAPEGEMRFVSTFTGPAYYTDEDKFNKIKFNKLKQNDVTYPQRVSNGWVGFIQHYFAALWLLSSYDSKPICSSSVSCNLNFKMVNNLAAAGVIVNLPAIMPHTSYSLQIPLFTGPQDYKVLSTIADHLELAKDYGWVYIFATPLFWLLLRVFALVHNWGFAIIILTLIVKSILYPLTRASYISMAKMKSLAPKMENIKTQYANDRMKLQQAMMELYKSEKVNPIGGCLPMILQIPVFIGLYWALLSSVELRQAHFLWISDLSKPDPFYILPLVLALTMFVQTFLNPAPADPVQAKMMRIMPIAFSVMFFFFPAGLVLYWLVNNILSIAQQWYVNNHVTLRRQNRQRK